MFNNKFKRSLLIASLSLNILFVLFFVGKRLYYGNWLFFHPLKPADTEQRWSIFLKSKPNKNEIIFLGTSITEGFNVEKGFNNPCVKNMGFAGSISENGIQVINKLIYRKPKKLFIEFGINDFRYAIHTDSVTAHLVAMINLIKAKSPGTGIFIQSVLPTSLDTLNAKIVRYNRSAKSICDSSNVTFINLYPEFLKGDKIDPDLTLDGIHLNQAGYFNWRRLIKGFVN